MSRLFSISRLTRLVCDAWLANQAAACVLASQFLATLVNAAAKYLESDNNNAINPLQILHGRMIVTALMCTLTLPMLGKDDNEGPCAFPSTHRLRGLLALRAIAGVFGVVGFYYSLVYLPLTEATSLNLLAPLAACCTMSIIDSAPFRTKAIIAVFSCFLGAILIVKPAFLFDSEESVGGKGRAVGAMFAVMGAVGACVSYVCVQRIGADLHPILVVKYFAISVLCVTSLIQLAIVTRGGVITLDIGSLEWALIVLMGVLGFAMEFLLSWGLSLDPTSRATQMIYVQTILSLIFDLVVWRAMPDLLSIFGCSIVLLSNISIVQQGLSTKKLSHTLDRENNIELLDNRGGRST